MRKNITQVKKSKLPGLIVTGTLLGAISVLFAFAPMPGKNTPWVAPGTADGVKNPIASDAASIEAGKAIYKKSCYDCHGKKGKGDGPKSGELDQNPQDFTKPEFQKQTDGALFWKISEGRKPMPSFKSEITKEQRWQAINYIRTLK